MKDGLFKIDNDNFYEFFNLCWEAWHFITDEISRGNMSNEFEKVLETIDIIRQINRRKNAGDLPFSEAYIPLSHMRVILKCAS